MKLSQSYRNIFQLLWAFAIVWVSLGSLINFHQHHLWNKQLIPQVVATVNKKDKSKVASHFKQNQENSNDNGIDQSAVLNPSFETNAVFASVTWLLQAQAHSNDLAAGLNRSPGLRAPPVL